MEKTKFFKCEHCGNLVGMIHSSGINMVCCGDKMTELKPNTTDAATEKHVPVIKKDGNNVTVEVGSVAHPMLPEHYIQWIYIETKNGGQRKALEPGMEPKATFTLVNDELVSAYAYCNLHGLWKADA
ncbi:MAG: desulfoferrodoxin [Anaerofustis sp.]